MAIDHLSLYQLTIEPGTRFGDLAARGRLRGLPDAEARRRHVPRHRRRSAPRPASPAYEISNHARPGAESRHNLVYWRYGDYAGIGPGAHGRLTPAAAAGRPESLRSPKPGSPPSRRDGSGISPAPRSPPPSRPTEMLMMGLRLAEGIDPRRYAALNGRPLPPRRIAELAALGLIAADRRPPAHDRRRPAAPRRDPAGSSSPPNSLISTVYLDSSWQSPSSSSSVA